MIGLRRERDKTLRRAVSMDRLADFRSQDYCRRGALTRKAGSSLLDSEIGDKARLRQVLSILGTVELEVEEVVVGCSRGQYAR